MVVSCMLAGVCLQMSAAATDCDYMTRTNTSGGERPMGHLLPSIHSRDRAALPAHLCAWHALHLPSSAALFVDAGPTACQVT